MDPLDKAKVERLRAAIKDRDLNGYTEVKPEDVAGITALVKDQSEAVKGLAKAAANNPPQAEGVNFRTDALAHLLEQVETTHKAPKPKEKDKE
jgi:hypothetical protein